MIIETRDFGKMELDEQALVEFRAPIFGFEEFCKYVILSDEDTGPGLLWLQSIEDAQVCFVLLDPEEIGLSYSPEVSDEVRALLQLSDVPIVRVIAVVPQDFKKTTVNLKSPIFINPKNQSAAQVLLDAEYPIRLSLFEEGEQ